MILQNLVFPQEDCQCDALYVRRHDSDEGECIDFCSYFNMFPVTRWRKYTGISDIYLDIESGGQMTLILIGVGFDGCREELSRTTVSGHDRVCIPDTDHELVGVHLIIPHGSEFIQGSFCTESSVERMPMMALNMCTFHRESLALAKMQSFIASLERFGEPYSSHVKMIVVDNGSTLDDFDHASVDVVRNSNIGGSGGFARGLYEARHTMSDLTHILFMDDDTVMDFESVYRVFSLLCYLKPEYSGYMIAGSMLSMEKPYEVYESGTALPSNEPLCHGIDVSDVHGISSLDSSPGPDVGGWWFFCSPHVSSDDYPMPFFVGYDDVAYSWMHGSSVISMVGIGVWHPDLNVSYRPSRQFYYDIRNSMFLNALQGHGSKRDIVLHFKRGVKEILFMRPRNADLISMALYDFSRGCTVLDDPIGINSRVQPVAYDIQKGKSPDVDPIEHVRNRKLWTALTFNGQLLSSRGVGKASKTCLDAWCSYRVQRMIHHDDGSGWFVTEKDVWKSIRSISSLLISTVRALIKDGYVRRNLSENNHEVSESYWEDMFDRIGLKDD